MKPWILVVALPVLAAACASPLRPQRAQAVPAVPPAAVQDPLDSIARFEDLRSDGEGLLQALASQGEERTRIRAVRALGRLPREDHGKSVSDALVAALDDRSKAVRAAAAFALGMRGDVATTGALAGAALEGTDELRAAAVEALSRIDDPRARRAVIEALGDESSAVRGAAALGVARFPREAAEGRTAEARLVERLVPGAHAGARELDPEVVWRGLFALARRGARGAGSAFAAGVSASDPRARIFALQGIGALPPGEAPLAAAIERLADSDWRVAVEAANALAKHADLGSVSALIEASARAIPPHAAHHVRRAAFEALGRIPRAAELAGSALERARSDESMAVRAAALEAGARLRRDVAAAALEAAAVDVDPVVRAGVAAASAHLSVGRALPLIERLLDDPALRVATIAAEALGAHAADPIARERLRALLAASDNGLRLSAATELAKTAAAADLPHLERALQDTRGEIAPEVAAAIVDAALRAGGPDGLALVRLACAHSDPYVARKARAAASAMQPDLRLPRAPSSPRRTGPLPAGGAAPRPRVAFETTRGLLVFELLTDEAPFHVENLVQLARRGHYDGTTFHRVVPDFVVQGGDVRGDGNGGTTWRGDALRAEFGPRPFRRGSLGMPRNDDPDSGGSQIFVCHRETPHLDGRYTLFGELVVGFDVLDALQVGDRIVTARMVGDGG